MALEAPRSILIIKLSAIGDVVHSIPVLEVLRRSYPHARIDWVVEEAASDIVKGHPAVDRVIVSRRKAWQRAVAAGNVPPTGEFVGFIRCLRSIRYDLVVDLQGLFKSGILVGLARGVRKVGMSGAREGSALFLSEPVVAVDRNIHAIDRYLNLAASLGCDITGWDGRLPVTEADEASAGRLLDWAGIAETPFVAVNPVAKWKTKLWLSGRFGSLCDRIVEETGNRVVFTGGREDFDHLQEIISAMRQPALNLAGKTGLRELASIYQRARLLITTDTGPMHIAAAVKCPVIALFGPTDPQLTGPYGDGHRVIRAGAPCSPCFRKKCKDPRCMTGIDSETVFNAAATFLIPESG